MLEKQQLSPVRYVGQVLRLELKGLQFVGRTLRRGGPNCRISWNRGIGAGVYIEKADKARGSRRSRLSKKRKLSPPRAGGRC